MSVLLCLPSDLETAVIADLSSTRSEKLVARRCADLVEVLAAARAHVGNVAIIGSDQALLDVTTVDELADYVAVVLVSIGAEERDLRALGAVEILGASVPEVANRIRHAAMETRQRKAPETDDHASGRVIAVWGPHGSHGRSTLVRDLSARAKQSGVERVLAVDCDTFGPSLAQIFDVEESSAIIALARAIDQGKTIDSDRLLVQSSASFAEVDVLIGLNAPERWREISRPVANRMWRHLRQDNALVFVDLAGGLGDRGDREDRYALTRSALTEADAVIHVAHASPIGIRRLVEHMDAASELSLAPNIAVFTGVRASALGNAPEKQLAGLLEDLCVTEWPVVVMPDVRADLDRALINATAYPRPKGRSEYRRKLDRILKLLPAERINR